MRSLPATVVSTTLEGPLDWPDATLVRGDAVDVVARLKEESGVPLRSHGSLSMNRALMAAGLADRVQVTLFPVITGQTGLDPIFRGAADSTSSSSRAGRSTAASRSSPTGPTCMSEAVPSGDPADPGQLRPERSTVMSLVRAHNISVSLDGFSARLEVPVSVLGEAPRPRVGRTPRIQQARSGTCVRPPSCRRRAGR